jgi:hypothetical protein
MELTNIVIVTNTNTIMPVSEAKRKAVTGAIATAQSLGTDPAAAIKTAAADGDITQGEINEIINGDQGVGGALSVVGETVKGSQIDPWFSTGGAADQVSFSMRKLALTDPESYEAARNLELIKIKQAVDTQFTTTLNAYKAAGYDIQTAESEALKAAKQSKDVLFKAMNLKFGDNDGIFLKGADYKNGAYKVPHAKH